MYNKIADCKTTVPPIKQDAQSSHQGISPIPMQTRTIFLKYIFQQMSVSQEK